MLRFLAGAAGGRKGWLTPAAFVATAPPPSKYKSACSDRARSPEVANADEAGDNGN